MINLDDYIENVFRSHDNSVSKYLHMDGSETSIKLVRSAQNVINPLTNQIETHFSDRNKYTIFISSSVGCFMKCKFCHLTLKNATHIKLEEEQVLNNVKAAIVELFSFNPEIANKFVKISWMGMGDAINKPDMVNNVSIQLMDWLLENSYAKGLDGVDLSTVMPKIKDKRWIRVFQELEDKLQKYPKNPIYTMDNIEFTNGYYSHKNLFRLFYSIESAIQEKRENVIPNAAPLISAIQDLLEYSQDGKHTVILHHLLVDGLNDSEEELLALVNLINSHFVKNELRILRYNFCSKSNYTESAKFITQVKELSKRINFLKVQVSAGTEVSAACGQFIVQDFIRSKKIILKQEK